MWYEGDIGVYKGGEYKIVGIVIADNIIKLKQGHNHEFNFELDTWDRLTKEGKITKKPVTNRQKITHMLRSIT